MKMIGWAKKNWVAIIVATITLAVLNQYGESVLDRIIDNHRKAEMLDW